MDPYIDDRLKADKTATFLDFVDDLRQLWEAAGKRGKIVRSFQKDKASYPIITYRILKRRPHPAFQEKKPRLRQTIRHPHQPGDFIEIYGQVYQVIVGFNVFSTSDEEADELAVELEEFLFQYKAFFKKRGVKEIYFLEQDEDETVETSHFPLVKRSLVFDMQFELIIPFYQNQIEQLAIQASIHKTINNKEES